MTSKPDSLDLKIDTASQETAEVGYQIDFLRRFAGGVDADCAGLVIDKLSADSFALISWRHSTEATAEYQAYYGHFDPLRSILAHQRDGLISIDTFVAPAYQQPEWRHDYLHRHGIRHLLVTAWRDSEDRYHLLGFQRYADARPFSAADLTFGNRLLTAWKAEQLMLQSGGAPGADVSHISAHILDRMDLCVVLVDEKLRVHFANQKAIDSFNSSTGVTLHNSSIRINNALEHHLLTKQVHNALRGMVATPMCLGEGSARWLLLLSPFSASTNSLALLLGRPADEPSNADRDQGTFSKAFNLTKAEGRLANALGRGETIEDYASRVGIAQSTARNQLRALLHKTGTARQVELVRLFCRFPNLQD